MIYFTGTQKDFSLSRAKASRYGFPALFFSTNPEHALLYAQHYWQQQRQPAAVYRIAWAKPLPLLDFGGGVSHSSHFRNTIFQLQRQGKAAWQISNVIDYPSEDLFSGERRNIVAFFDLAQLPELELYGELSF